MQDKLKLYVSLNHYWRAAKISDSLDCMWPDASEVLTRYWSLRDIRKYVARARSVGYSIDLTDVQEILN